MKLEQLCLVPGILSLVHSLEGKGSESWHFG